LAQEKLLTNQAKVLREDLRRTQRQQADMEDQLALLKAKATEQALQSKATEESLKATVRSCGLSPSWLREPCAFV
jgi:hypothetical protein